jgi:type II secretory pathway pseudopilin PulG
MNRADRGFTIIELMLAMMFVSMLLLGIALTVIQIGNVYNKGLTMKAVDQAGRSIANDMRLVISESQPIVLDSALKEQRYPNSDPNSPDGGRFCTGQFSYIWNYGKSIDRPINKYALGDDVVRFARVKDNGAEYCAQPNKPVLQQDATELLAAGDRDLAIQSFSIIPVASDPTVGQAIYRIIMEIGTNNQGAIQKLSTQDTSCKPPNDDGALQEFCSVNRFDFTAIAGNKGGQ